MKDKDDIVKKLVKEYERLESIEIANILFGKPSKNYSKTREYELEQKELLSLGYHLVYVKRETKTRGAFEFTRVEEMWEQIGRPTSYPAKAHVIYTEDYKRIDDFNEDSIHYGVRKE